MSCSNVKKFKDLYRYCGKRGHGKSAPACIRQTQCSVYGNRCMHCHIESVCCSKDRARRLTPAAPSDNEGAIFDALCSIHTMGNTHGRSAIPLGYQVYDNLSDTWLRKRSTAQPFVDITVKIVPDDYYMYAFGVGLSTLTTSWSIYAMEDTGCQICLAGLKVICHLGLRRSDLLLFNLQMHTCYIWRHPDPWDHHPPLVWKRYTGTSHWNSAKDSSSARKHAWIISPCKKQCDDRACSCMYIVGGALLYLIALLHFDWKFYRRSISCTTVFIIRSLSIWVSQPLYADFHNEHGL